MQVFRATSVPRNNQTHRQLAHMSDPMPLDRLRHGDPDAAREVVTRYTSGLMSLARAHLPDRVRPRFGPEDVIQSVYRTFFSRCRDGRLTVPAGADLWALLSVITLRKCHNCRAHADALRRDSRRERRWPLVLEAPRFAAHDPGPADLAVLADAISGITAALPFASRQIVELTLTGASTDQISTALGCPERTVRRVRARFRDDLIAMLGAEP